jgi:cytochrome c peroxidase
MVRITKARFLFMLAAATVLAGACVGRTAQPDESLVKQARDVFGVLPDVMTRPENPLTPEKVALGKMLFYEKRISADGTVSCWRCHPLSLYAADGLPKSIGVGCRPAGRNAPTLLNAADQIAEHWVGNRTSVEDQATKSLTGGFGQPSEEAAVARLKAIPGYEPLFRQAFPGESDPLTAANFGRAVGAFERTLVTPAPFDAFLNGGAPGLDEAQQNGLREFIDTGCSSCHNGPYLGGGSFQKFGVVEPYWKYTLSPVVDDGRSAVTGDAGDKYVFKVPVLRNVRMTPPYFHDGSVVHLIDAVRIMGKVQLGQDLAEIRIMKIVAFLDALTGRLATASMEVPSLPALEVSGPDPGPGSDSASTPAPTPVSTTDAPAGFSPNEDLMQEHALLARLLLIYEEIARRLDAGREVDSALLRGTAQIVRQFVELYHERDEEDHIFPRFVEPHPLASLVRTLLLQHEAGRALTERIIKNADAAAPGMTGERRRPLLESIRAFVRMYRPHAAREGSVLFPAFRELVPAKEFFALGDVFEAKEHEALGPEGFEGQVALVAALEKRLGIEGISRFTPERQSP